MDGLDGCGKDTHAARIVELLRSSGMDPVLRFHPSKGRAGRLAKRFLQGSGPIARGLATLFFTVNILESVRQYKKNPDRMFVFVRYLLGTAYLPPVLAPIGYMFFRRFLPFPDLAIFIDIEPEVAVRRIQVRGHAPEMFETMERMNAVRKIARRLVSSEWVTVDNSIDGEQPFLETERVVSRMIGRSPWRLPATTPSDGP